MKGARDAMRRLRDPKYFYDPAAFRHAQRVIRTTHSFLTSMTPCLDPRNRTSATQLYARLEDEIARSLLATSSWATRSRSSRPSRPASSRSRARSRARSRPAMRLAKRMKAAVPGRQVRDRRHGRLGRPARDPDRPAVLRLHRLRDRRRRRGGAAGPRRGDRGQEELRRGRRALAPRGARGRQARSASTTWTWT